MYKITKLIIFSERRPCLLAFYLAMALFIHPAIGQSANANANNTLINLHVKNTNLFEVLTQLKSQSGYDFFYDREAVQKVAVEQLSLNRTTVPEAMNRIRRALPISYEIQRKEVSVRVESQAQFEQRKAQQRPGRISGRILDDKGETLPAASIRVLSSGRSVQSGADGTFQLSLDPGTYTIEVSYMGYQSKRITDIVVKPGANTPLDVALVMASSTLGEVTVTSSYKKASIEGLYARQKNNAAVSDGITAEQISRTPDNNTAQVLARVSGLQVSDDKYVVVRGLSDRYNNVLLNGAMLPSSEPNRRNFAFDMVPSALLDRIVVNKTATPDLTGEFTGGLVQVETKDIPTENFFQLSIGSGYNSMSTGKDMIGLDRGENAWAGFASDVHKKPTGMTFGEYNQLEAGIARNAPADNEDRMKMHQFLGTMPDNWKMYNYVARPTQNYQLQVGRVVPFKNESRLGLIAALTYRNDQRIEERDIKQPGVHVLQGMNNTYATTLGGSFNLGYQFGGHKLTLQNTYNRKFSDNLWKYTGVDIDNSEMHMDSYTNVTVINQLFQTQLGGEHTLTKSGIKADWFASTAWMDRDQPYSKLLARQHGQALEDNPEGYFTYNLSDNRLKGGNMFYSELHERMSNWAANVTVPFRLLDKAQTFKFGYQGKHRTADFEANLYRTLAFGAGTQAFGGVPYYDVYNQNGFATNLYLHAVSAGGGNPIAGDVNGYDAFQRLNAFYGMLDIKPLEKLRLIGGVRAEKNDQNIFDVQRIAPGEYERVLLNNKQTDWLPSANAIYAITDKINMRAAWYKTVARPDFREFSRFSYFDYDLFAMVQGAPLETTNIENSDIRLEYYPSPGEIISISGFYKKFKNPIEIMHLVTSGGFAYYYINLESAMDKGIEFDFRKSLDFISPSSGVLSKLYLSGNFTWLDANVKFKAEDAVDEAGNPIPVTRDRPLAGQSPYVVNGGLMYAGDAFGMNVAYNRYGPRITFASPYRTVDEYENSRDMLDVQLSYKFLKQRRAEVKLNISDLLNQEQQFYQNRFDEGNPLGYSGGSVQHYPDSGQVPDEQIDPKGTKYNKDYDTVTRRYKFGTTYTLNLTYRF